MNPYDLLPPLFADADRHNLAFRDHDEKLNNGGAAMAAWARMQFCDMCAGEREDVAAGLFRYCELDTLAIVMAWGRWTQCQIWIGDTRSLAIGRPAPAPLHRHWSNERRRIHTCGRLDWAYGVLPCSP
jgi:hypothetical protein